MPIKHEPRQHSRQYNYDDMVDVTESEHDGDDGDECSDDGHLIGNELRMDDILMRPEVFRFYRSLDASAVPRDSPVNYNMPNDINNPQVPFDQLIYTMLDRVRVLISYLRPPQFNILCTDGYNDKSNGILTAKHSHGRNSN
jgi:hypothetical protein